LAQGFCAQLSQVQRFDLTGVLAHLHLMGAQNSGVMTLTAVFLLVLGIHCGPSFTPGMFKAPSQRVPERSTSDSPMSSLSVQDKGQEQVADSSIPGVLLTMCMAMLVLLLPLQSAKAARMGGRMGGATSNQRQQQQQRSAPSQQRAMPQGNMGFRSGPSVSIGVGPMFAPPMFGTPFMAPPLFMPPPILPVPFPSGPRYTDQMLQNQQSRDERQLDAQKAQIQQLEKEIADLKASKR